jgi:phage-related protein
VASRRLEVIIAGDSKGAKDAFDEVEGSAGGLGSRLGSALGGVAKVVGVAAIAGVAGIGVALKGAWDAAEESAKIGRETERVIRTTGGAANVTADEVGNLAGAISDATGADDELIQSGANLLLTFTNVKNVVGAGNDVFNQATGLALDMATALGTDMSGASIQLGKALNDPIKGITALSKAGVSFTEQQKTQIKTLVEHGDMLGAQKIILAELSKEFGGAAEAAGTPLDKLRVKIGNFQEAIGAELIPIVNTAVDWISERLAPAFEQAQVVFGEVVGGVRAFASAWQNANDGITSNGFAGAMESAAIQLRHFYDDVSVFATSAVLPALSTGLDVLRNAAMTAWNWVPVVSGWLANHKEILIGVAAVIGGVLLIAIGQYTVAMGTAAATTIAATWPFLLIIAAVAALAVGVAYLWNNWDTFRNVIQGVVAWLVANVPPVFAQVQAVLQQFISTVLAPMIGYIQANSEAFANIGKVLLAVVGIIVGVVLVALAALVVGSLAMTAAAAAVVVGFVALIAVLYNVAQVVWDVFNNVRNALGGVIDWFENVIQVGWDLAQNIGSALADAIRWVYNVGAAVSGMADSAAGKLNELIGWFAGLPGRVAGAVGDLSGLLVGAGRSIVQGLLNGIGSMAGAIGDKVHSLASMIPDWARGPLGIHSPSKVFIQIGRNVVEGLQVGIDDQTSALQHSVAGVAAQVQGPTAGGFLDGLASGPQSSGGGVSRPGGGVHVHVNIPYGYVGDEEMLGRAIVRSLKAADRQGARMPWGSFAGASS